MALCSVPTWRHECCFVLIHKKHRISLFFAYYFVNILSRSSTSPISNVVGFWRMAVSCEQLMRHVSLGVDYDRDERTKFQPWLAKIYWSISGKVCLWLMISSFAAEIKESSLEYSSQVTQWCFYFNIISWLQVGLNAYITLFHHYFGYISFSLLEFFDILAFFSKMFSLRIRYGHERSFPIVNGNRKQFMSDLVCSIWCKVKSEFVLVNLFRFSTRCQNQRILFLFELSSKFISCLDYYFVCVIFSNDFLENISFIYSRFDIFFINESLCRLSSS